MAELKSKKPTQILDFLGTTCPYPIIITKKEMGKLPKGAILKIICDLPAFIEETIPRFVEMHEYEYEVVKINDKGYWEIYIKKT
jgi:TusA-related sulfurtransferase